MWGWITLPHTIAEIIHSTLATVLAAFVIWMVSSITVAVIGRKKT